MKGWVYIITNKALNGLVKVGFTEKDPQYRARSLSNAAHPYPCVVEYEALVSDPRDVEAKAHIALLDKRENKEWFRCSIEDAVQVISHVASEGVIFEQFHYVERVKGDSYAWEEELIEWIKFAEEKTNRPLLMDIPKSYDSLRKIKELNLCSRRVKEIPDSIFKLESLKEIILMNNEIKNVPRTIGAMKNLEYINLGDNSIRYLPEQVCDLSSMKTLYIHLNSLESLPYNIGKLKNLRELIVFSNNLTKLPESICELTNLEKLHLTGNKIKYLPSGFKKLNNLKELFISFNKLERFPDCLLELDSLEDLSISDNTFERRRVPKIRDFKSLKILDK